MGAGVSPKGAQFADFGDALKKGFAADYDVPYQLAVAWHFVDNPGIIRRVCLWAHLRCSILCFVCSQ